MRALFVRVAISLKTVQMLIGSRQDVFRHATDTLLAGDWFHRFGPNWRVRIDDSREFIRALLKKSTKKSHVVVAGVGYLPPRAVL